MDARQAQTLQRHALDSLGELRTWLCSREAELAPAATASAQHAAYAAWAAQVEAAIRAVSKGFAECERRSSPASAPVEPDADSVPPTLPSLGAGYPGEHLVPPPSSDAPSSARQQPPRSSR